MTWCGRERIKDSRYTSHFRHFRSCHLLVIYESGSISPLADCFPLEARMCARLQLFWPAKTRLSSNHHAHGTSTIITFQVASCPRQNQAGSQRIRRANADPVDPCETRYHPWPEPSAAATHPNYSQPTEPKLSTHPHRIHLSR